MRGEVEKRWIIPHFYGVTWMIFETVCPTTKIFIGPAIILAKRFYFFLLFLTAKIY